MSYGVANLGLELDPGKATNARYPITRLEGVSGTFGHIRSSELKLDVEELFQCEIGAGKNLGFVSSFLSRALVRFGSSYFLKSILTCCIQVVSGS